MAEKTRRRKKAGLLSKGLTFINRQNVLLGLILATIGIIVALVTWYSTFAAPDIRPITGPRDTHFKLECVKHLSDKSEVLVSIKDTFKNYSFWKEGYIDKAEVFQPKFKGRAEVEISTVSKDIIYRREEKTVHLLLRIILDQLARSELYRDRETAQLNILFYDNTGRPIELHPGHTHTFYLTFTLSDSPDTIPKPPVGLPPPH